MATNAIGTASHGRSTAGHGNQPRTNLRGILASLAVEPPRQVQIVAAWSSAAATARPGIELLAQAGCEIVELGGLSKEAVEEWLRVERVDTSHTERVYQLTGGYPLLVEGLIGHLRAGESIDAYTGLDVFVKVLDAALLRLSPEASSAARKLSAFVEPIAAGRITDYLGVTPVEWGTIRAGLEHERILTVAHGDQRWFHEMRRNHLWNDVMDESERSQVADAAFDVLLEEHLRRGGSIDTGLAVPIAGLASLATNHLAADPALAAAVEFGADELAVIAAMMELSSDNEAFIVTADAVLIHARATFGGADDLIDTFVKVADSGFLELQHRQGEPGSLPVDTQRAEIVELDPVVEVVVHGRIQTVLGRPAIPKVASLVARTHLEELRLESTFMVIAAEEADTLDLISWANMCRSFLREPMLGVACDSVISPSVSQRSSTPTPTERPPCRTYWLLMVPSPRSAG